MKLNHMHKSLKDAILRKRFKTTMLECVKMKSLKTYLKGNAQIILKKRLFEKRSLFEENSQKKKKFALFFFSKRLKMFFFFFFIYKKDFS